MNSKRRLGILLAILAVGAAISAWLNVPPLLLRRRAAEHYRLGLAYERDGKGDRALAEWRIAASIDRDYPAPYYKLGDYLLSKADRPDLAAQNFRWLIGIDPQGPHLYCRLTQALALQNEVADARGFAAMAIKAEPDCPLAHHVLGILLVTDHRIKEGIPHLEAAHRIDPDSPMFATVLAKAYLDTSDFPRAERVLGEVLTRDPNNAEAHYLLGWAFNRGVRSPETARQAEAHFRAATRLRPDDAGSFSELGKLQLQTGRLREARTSLETALQINPRLVQAASSLILVYGGLGEKAKAARMEQQARALMARSDHLRELQKQAEMHPDDVDVTTQLAGAELDDGNLTDAMRYIQAVLARRPADRAALKTLLRIYVVGGKPELAESVRDHLTRLPGQDTAN